MLNKSVKTYIVLILVLAFFAGLSVFLFSSQLLPIEELSVSRPILALVNVAVMLFVYGGLGFLGYKISQKLGFADIWDSDVSNKQRFIVPAVVGVGAGVFFIVTDLLISRFHSLGKLPHPDFPLSLVASITAGIGEEVVFRLFFVSLWVWLVSFVMLKKRYLNQVFWVVSLVSALAFAAGHIPSVMAILGLDNMNQIPFAMLIEIFVLNIAVSIPAAYYFRKYGFLAAVGIHFWTDVVWHVIYGFWLQ